GPGHGAPGRPAMAWQAELLTPARPVWTLLAGVSFGLLPRWARRMYRLPGVPGTDLAVTTTARSLRVALQLLPDLLREGPHYQKAKARLAAIPVRGLETVPQPAADPRPVSPRRWGQPAPG